MLAFFEYLSTTSLKEMKNLTPCNSGFSGHLIEIFGHVVEEIEALVWNQLEAVNSRLGSPPKYVILVGGFGRSGYLATSLRNLVDPRKTSVLHGTGSTPYV